MADFTLEGFISNLQNQDFARGYTFYCRIDNSGYLDENDRYLVKTSSLPASQLGVAEANWQGNTYKLATTNEYSDFTISFNVDPDAQIRTKFLSWVDEIHDIKTNAHGNPNDYMATIVLEHLSHYDGSVIMTYKLMKAFPTNVGELSLDYGSKEIATFDVTFAYQWHEYE